MTSAKFASLHGDLLARKGRATPATGEVNAESLSAKEISALRLYPSDGIQRLKSDPEVLFNGRKHSFDSEMPTPELGSHKEKETPAVIAAAPETEERVHEAEDAQLAPLIVEPEAAIERRQFDQGPPRGVPERRRPPVFGKRGATRTPLSEMSQKRFNA